MYKLTAAADDRWAERTSGSPLSALYLSFSSSIFNNIRVSRLLRVYTLSVAGDRLL